MSTEQDVEQLVQQNTGLVTTLVNRTLRLFPRLPRGYDHEDLRSLGNIGLLSAARTYDPRRGVAFSTYAYRCIEYAIAGELKREWNKQIECVSLNQLFEEDDKTLEDQLADGSVDAAAIAFGRRDREVLEAALEGLPAPQARVIRMLYFDGESVPQVAKQWGLSAQAIQNLHLRGLKAMRLRLSHVGIRQWDN